MFSATTLTLIAVLPAFADEQPSTSDRQVVVTVLGKPVYRSAGSTKKLSSTVLRPLFAEFQRVNKQSITPTKAELEKATRYWEQEFDRNPNLSVGRNRKALKEVTEKLKSGDLTDDERVELETEQARLKERLAQPMASMMTSFFLKSWKPQKYLYENYGGGRILWQQAGVEAYDATRTWLEEQEKNGKLVFANDEVRKEVLSYWLTQDDSPFLTDDKERIQEWLEPAWLNTPPTE